MSNLAVGVELIACISAACYGPRSDNFRIGCRTSLGCMLLTHVIVSSDCT
jgi:hypothetical protein